MSEKSAQRHEQLRLEHRRMRLERRYRRLLALYPAGYRAANGDEMLGVLLASAGEARPLGELADAADLIAGAFRIRSRGLGRRLRDPRWTPVRDRRWADALAAISVIFPVLLLAVDLAELGFVQAVASVVTGEGLGQPWSGGGGDLGIWPLSIGVPATVLLMLLRLRRTAALAAATTAVALLVIAPGVYDTWGDPTLAVTVLLAGGASVALFLSPGPARGLSLLRWWGTALTAAGGLMLTGLTAGSLTQFNGWSGGVQAMAAMFSNETATNAVATAMVAIGACTIVALACLRTPVTRRILVVLAIPAVPFAFVLQNNINRTGGFLSIGLPGNGVPVAQLYLPPLVIVIGILAAASLRRPRRTPL